jgi:hypothetical protein
MDLILGWFRSRFSSSITYDFIPLSFPVVLSTEVTPFVVFFLYAIPSGTNHDDCDSEKWNVARTAEKRCPAPVLVRARAEPTC